MLKEVDGCEYRLLSVTDSVCILLLSSGVGVALLIFSWGGIFSLFVTYIFMLFSREIVACWRKFTFSGSFEGSFSVVSAAANC